MSVTYSEEDRVNALATLEANGGNVKRTAQQLGIPRGTLITWRDKSEPVTSTLSERVSEVIDTKTAEVGELVERWMNVQNKFLDVVEHSLDTYITDKTALEPDQLKHLMVGAGITADKHLDYRDGRKGAQVNVSASAQAGVVIQRTTRDLNAG